MTFISPSVERVLGYTVQEVLGTNVTDRLTPAERREVFANYRKNLEEGRFSPRAVERELICKDGSTKQCEVVHSWMLDENGGPVGLVGVARDITERKRAERELRKSEERYRTILESINEGYFETDLRGRLTFFNEALRKMLGYTREELMTMDNRDYSSPETAKKTFQVFRRIYETGKPAKLMNFETITKDGSVRYHEISASLMQNPEGQPIGFRGVARDITDKKRMEEEKEVLERQLRHAQTMEVIGTLAAGIAHDFNNILSSIIGYTELALEDLPEGASVQSDMKQVLNAGLRAKDLVKQLLSFSREEKQEFQPVRVSAVIEEALKFIMQTIPSNIEIRQNISAKTERVWADPAEIHRVVINLCVNAAYAMREKGGILEVDLVKVDLEDPLVVRRLNVQPGPYLKLTVRDTGEGIEAVNLDRIFDPYFTTKQRTEGTGLGLAVVHGVVESCGGAITVQSKLGEGATFDVFLPVITGGEESVREVTAQQPGEKKARILFVDDEEPIATLAKRTLERLGYRVEVRTSSLEVLEVFRARPDQFDLVITDYMMPNMTGVKLAEEIKRIRRDVPIILCTGYSETVAQEQAESIGIREILMKPLVREEITRAIQDALDPE